MPTFSSHRSTDDEHDNACGQVWSGRSLFGQQAYPLHCLTWEVVLCRCEVSVCARRAKAAATLASPQLTLLNRRTDQICLACEPRASRLASATAEVPLPLSQTFLVHPDLRDGHFINWLCAIAITSAGQTVRRTEEEGAEISSDQRQPDCRERLAAMEAGRETRLQSLTFTSGAQP